MILSASRLLAMFAAIAMLALGVAACGDDDDEPAGGGGDSASVPADLSGSVRIDGSSTVGPLSSAVAERFNEQASGVEVQVGQVGTGGGFERFCAGETDINDASRAIEPEEVALCKQGGIKYEEIVVANDALTVVVNPNNPVTCMSPEELSQIWGEQGVANWSEVQGLEEEFDAEVARFGPGTDSGTFDFFTEFINGEEGVQTSDYNNVGEDDNQTVTGVEGSEGGIGYFGFSYFQENEGNLKALEIENEQGECVAPSVESVQDGSYNPLGRELFIYPSDKALAKPEGKAFVDFYLESVTGIAEEIGFIGLTEEQLTESQDKVAQLGS